MYSVAAWCRARSYSSGAGPSDRSDSTFIDVFEAMQVRAWLHSARASYARLAPFVTMRALCVQAMDLSQIKSRGDADKALSAAIPADGLRAFVLTNLKLDKKAKRFGWRCNLEVLRASIADIMDFPSASTPYSGQTLFIGGAESNYIAPAHMEAIQRLFPEALVEHVAGAGHFVHVDQPRLVGERIASFITG